MLKADIADEAWLTVGDSYELCEFIGGMVTIGVPFDAPIDFKRRVHAAAHSYVAGNKSIDHFLKKYGSRVEFTRPSKGQRALCEFLRSVKYEVEAVYRELTSDVERENCLGLFASEACLARTFTTIRMAIFMLMRGYPYEAAALMRVILEQMAWSWAIHALDDDCIFKMSPTRSISALKSIVDDAGKKYRLLSDYTHINPELQNEYLDFSGECPAVLHSQHERSAQMAIMLGRLADDYRVVAERISFKYFATPVAWERNAAGELVLREKRPFAEKVDEYFKRIVELTEQGPPRDLPKAVPPEG